MAEEKNKAVKDKIKTKRKEIDDLRLNIAAYGDPEGELTAKRNKLLAEVRDASKVFDK